MQRWTILHIYKFVTLPDGIWHGLRDWLGDLDKNKPMQQERRKMYTLEAWSVAEEGEWRADEEVPQLCTGPTMLAGTKLRHLHKQKKALAHMISNISRVLEKSQKNRAESRQALDPRLIGGERGIFNLDHF